MNLYIHRIKKIVSRLSYTQILVTIALFFLIIPLSKLLDTQLNELEITYAERYLEKADDLSVSDSTCFSSKNLYKVENYPNFEFNFNKCNFIVEEFNDKPSIDSTIKKIILKDKFENVLKFTLSEFPGMEFDSSAICGFENAVLIRPENSIVQIETSPGNYRFLSNTYLPNNVEFTEISNKSEFLIRNSASKDLVKYCRYNQADFTTISNVLSDSALLEITLHVKNNENIEDILEIINSLKY